MRCQRSSVQVLAIPRFHKFTGQVALPGSKSIANRAILMAALCAGRTRLSNLPAAEDVEHLLIVLPALGVRLFTLVNAKEEALTDAEAIIAALHKRQDIILEARGGAFVCERAVLNIENAGTAMRPLVAVLAAGRGHFTIDGNQQMRRRPIGDLVQGLASLGVKIHCTDTNFPPVTIDAQGLPPGRVELSGKVSSQFISAILLAAPLAQAEAIELILPEEPVSKPYIDLTLAMLAEFGIKVQHRGYRYFKIEGAQTFRSPGVYAVEGDASAATYFLAAGGLPGLGPVRIDGLGSGSRQGDIEFVNLMREMGASVQVNRDHLMVKGPAAGTKLRAVDRDMNAMPDAAMTLAILALFADGETHIRNIENLRVKESERIAGLRSELEKLGAQVREDRDALHITPPESLQPARIATFKDHRMAMAFSVAAFGTDLELEDPACVAKTYRHFFEDFLPLAGRNAPA